MRSYALLPWLVAPVLVAGCGGGARTSAPAAPAPAAIAARSCARTHAGGALPVDPPRSGSSVALAALGSREIAYVADRDDGVLHTVDVATQRELSTTKLAGSPSQLLVAADGRVFVALRDASSVEVLEPAADVAAPLASRCLVPTAAEPLGLAVTPDDATLVVSSGWGAAVSGYATADLRRTFEVRVPREPRAVVVSDDGRKAYVSHVVGSRMSVVDLASPAHAVRTIDLTGEEDLTAGRSFGSLATDVKDRRACQGFALAKAIDAPKNDAIVGERPLPKGRIFAPQVLVDPGDARAPSDGYGSGGALAAEVGSIAVVDEGNDRPMDPTLFVTLDLRQRSGVGRGAPECILPRAAAVDPARAGLLVACLGIDAVVEYDARAADPRVAERRRWSVPAGPSGIAIDAKARKAYVWSEFDRTLDVIDLGAKDASPLAKTAPVVSVALSQRAHGATTGDVALGRRLFHTSGDPRISSDGRACASCHPDGRDDSLTWATPDGPRQTPMLAGRLGETAPYGWNGAGKDVREHLGHTFARLKGQGLSPRELDALIAYVTTMAPPPSDAASEDRALVARGAEVFHSAETGCANCHTRDGAFTDGSAHDVGSHDDADRDARFDTPSLRFVGGTAPYFHDGRYASLRELLVGADGKMGHTKQLSERDLVALEAYLRSL